MNAPSNTLTGGSFLYVQPSPLSTGTHALRMFTAPSTADPEVEALVVENMPLFRTGTFKDSEGREMTWESEHVDAMIHYFGELKSRRILQDVPVRKGHRQSASMFSGPDGGAIMDGMVGYITSVRKEANVMNPTDGNHYDYVFGRLEILDDEGKKKVRNRLWRNVSAEIGPTLTNAGEQYWPTIRGVAYVDFSAVQGLRLHSQAENTQYTLMMEEGLMSGTTANPQGPAPQQQPPAPQPQAPQPSQFTAPQHPSAPAPQPEFQFQLGDRTSSNFSEVQAFITAMFTENKGLRDFRDAAVKKERTDFCEELIRTNRYGQQQRDELVQYVESIDDRAFESFKKLHENQAPMQILQNHSAAAQAPQQFMQQPPAQAPAPAQSNEAQVHRETVAMFQLSNTPVEEIKKTHAYRELVRLDSTFSL